MGEDALAFILGHELAHFYSFHPLLAGSASAEPTTEQLAGRRSLEEDADRKGLLRVHLTGYRGAAVAPAAIDALYGLYNLRSNLEGYATRDARVSATGNVAKKVGPLLPLYPQSMSLLAGRHYAEAALVLEYLGDNFRSPDLVYNAALIQAMLGLSKTPSAVPYAETYPFILSSANHLASSLRGSRGGDADPQPHLKKAATVLERFLEVTPRDPALRVNLALIYDLLGRQKEGLELLGQGVDDTPETLPYRVKAQAILWRHAGQIVRTRQSLAKAEALQSPSLGSILSQ